MRVPQDYKLAQWWLTIFRFCSKASRSLAACIRVSSGLPLRSCKVVRCGGLSGAYLCIEHLSAERPTVQLLQRVPVQLDGPLLVAHQHIPRAVKKERYRSLLVS